MDFGKWESGLSIDVNRCIAIHMFYYWLWWFLYYGYILKIILPVVCTWCLFNWIHKTLILIVRETYIAQNEHASLIVKVTFNTLTSTDNIYHVHVWVLNEHSCWVCHSFCLYLRNTIDSLRVTSGWFKVGGKTTKVVAYAAKWQK